MTANPLIPDTLPDWLASHADEIVAWGPAPVARGCWVVGCRRDAHLHGLCKTHHSRATETWKPRPSQVKKRRRPAEVVPEHDTEAEPQAGGGVTDSLRAPSPTRTRGEAV